MHTSELTNQQLEHIALASYCFYELDDKYSTENDCEAIDNWLKEKSNLILRNETVKNIFNHNGGGPNGAEWNPSTNLYVAVLYSSISQGRVNKPDLFINGKTYKEKLLEYNSNLIWYRVKQEFWTNESRTINSLDIKEMYSSEFLEDLNTENVQTITDLDYGEILKFRTCHDGDTILNFFHATYGE